MKKRSNQGFSLVELIVVIAILSILVGVAVPVYSGYIKKAQEAADAEYLANLSKSAQLFAAENGLELESVWVAPEVKEDRGIELVLKDKTVYNGDMSSLYAMLGGTYNFATIDKTQEIVYREDVPKDSTEDKLETTCTNHVIVIKEQATCLKDGYKGCDNCDYFERIPASGHKTSAEQTVGNLTVYKCEHAGCDFVEVRFEGDKIG